jgi:hypothetical protein
MKTKLILILNALWVVLAALNESGLLDLVNDEKGWLKGLIAFILILANAFIVKPHEAKDFVQRTVNPTPKPPKPPNP